MMGTITILLLRSQHFRFGLVSKTDTETEGGKVLYDTVRPARRSENF
jgi:hypothetical protein